METLLGKKVVTVGGGTGGFVLNSALRKYAVSCTAICTVFDSGGSTGRLRDAHGVLPSGDLRRLMVALADGDGGASETLRHLFNFRFPEGNGSVFHDHSMGNLLLAAAESMWGRPDGIHRLCRLLNVKGDVYPVSIDDAELVAQLTDGTVLRGEGAIDTRDPHDARQIASVHLAPDAFILREAAEALMQADLIVLGPGDHYTSLVPNLLVRGFADAIAASSAKVVYVASIMTKASETDGFTVLDFVNSIYSYGFGRDTLDAVLVNVAVPPDPLRAMYAEKENAHVVMKGSNENLDRLVGTVVEGDFLSTYDLGEGLIRHDGARVVQALLAL